MRHAPSTVQPTSQPAMTIHATVTDSGTRTRTLPGPLPPIVLGSRAGSMCAIARPTMTIRWRLMMCGMTLREKIGVKMSSTTIIVMTAIVRWPINDEKPSPTTSPIIASSSNHPSVDTINENGGERKSCL